MLAACTTLPVIGVPVGRPPLDGMDALLSIVQMPTGVPVATVAIGASANAAILAARILALGDPALAERVAAQREAQAEKARTADRSLGG
jgi:phosphoribosylaminoimidazole carboxylase PurE protein